MLQIQESNDEELVLKLWVGQSFVTALRHVIHGEVETMAIEDIVFEKNESQESNEFLSHHISNIVLSCTNIDSFIYKKQCACDNYCQHCSALFHLNVQNEQKSNVTIYSRHLKALNKTVYVTHMDTPLFTLKPGARVDATLIARKGCGDIHAKWRPATVVGFRRDLKVQLHPSITAEQFQSVAKGCPTKVFEDIEDIQSSKCIYCQRCIKQAQDMQLPDLVTIQDVPDYWIFNLESTGSMLPSQIFLAALRIMENRLIKMSEVLT